MKTHISAAVGLLLAAMLAWDAASLARMTAWNRRFAAAYAWAERGQVQAAFDGYRELEGAADARVRRRAKFNSATLYLQQSLAQRTSGDGAALALVELAKQSYRELLREDPDDWDARYNLERALRLAPETGEAAPDLPPPPDSRHTPSSTRGVTLGMP